MPRTTPGLELLRQQIIERFREVNDPRVTGRCSYNLMDLLVASFLAMVSGFQNYSDMEFFCVSRCHWLRKYVDFSRGIPSHDTFRRVLGLLMPEELEKTLREWAAVVSPSPKRVGIDGKSIKGNEKRLNQGKNPLNLVNVFDLESNIVLTQARSIGGGRSESSAAIESIKLLNLKGALVSMDAGLSDQNVSAEIIKKKANYLVPIKGKNLLLHKLFESYEGAFEAAQKKSQNFASSEERGHGRFEKRECVVADSEELIREAQKHRKEIQTIFKITRYRQTEDLRPMLQITGADGKQSYIRNDNPQTKRETRESVYYISSAKLEAEEALKHAREHWGIENKLHWILDVHFHEDACQVRDKRAARNLSALRKLAFNVFSLLPDPTEFIELQTKPTMKQKMKLASLDEGYLAMAVKALAQPQQYI